MNSSTTLHNHSAFRTVLSIVLFIFAIALGYEYVKPASATHRPERREFSVVAERTAPGTQLPILSVFVGDLVSVTITSRERGLVMVHGFDDMPEVSPGQPVIFRMNASKSGRFSLHLHAEDGTQIEIATIEVKPSQ